MGYMFNQESFYLSGGTLAFTSNNEIIPLSLLTFIIFILALGMMLFY